jgi:hypothetical protein
MTPSSIVSEQIQWNQEAKETCQEKDKEHK